MNSGPGSLDLEAVPGNKISNSSVYTEQGVLHNTQYMYFFLTSLRADNRYILTQTPEED